MPAELKKCSGSPKEFAWNGMEFCTIICNVDRPVNAFKVKFKGCDLVRSLKILEEFDKTSQNHGISKYCKDIGMQKSTLEKMLIIPGRHGFSAFFIA